MREEKAALRAAMQQRRAAEDAAMRAQRSARAQQHLVELPEFGRAGTIAFYWAMAEEVDTQHAIATALGQGRRVALPRVTRRAGIRQMMFHQYTGSPAELVPGPFGLTEPAATAPVVEPEEMDLVVVPGLAFDGQGGRLGYGGGYYDRFLPLVRPEVPRFGFCFAFQVQTASVPRGSHDILVHGTVTDAEVRRF